MIASGIYVNAETARNSGHFDASVKLLDSFLRKPDVAASMGTFAVERCISLLDYLVPAQIKNGVATLSKKQIAAGKVAVLFAENGDSILIDRKIHGDHAKVPKSAQTRMSAKSREAILFADGGLVTWSDIEVEGYEDRSKPIVVLDRNTEPYHRSSIFVHELTHVHQCLDMPLHTREYFHSKDCVIREELEAYDWEARYEAGIIGAGYETSEQTLPMQVNQRRISLSPPANDPYRPSDRLERQLKRDLDLTF